MKNLFKFNQRYFLLTVLLFIIEVLIALFVDDRFIRPYFGDFLVTILMYCFVRSFLNTPVLPTAIAVLVFSYFIETLQYFQLVSRLGLQHSRFARTVLGSSFEWMDLVAYTLGIVLVIYLERNKLS